MKLRVYSVLDKALGAYLPPFFCRSPAEAVRSFSDACQRQDSPFKAHAEDFVLMSIGEWDDDTGMFAPAEPVRVVGATEFASIDSPFSSSSHVS